METNEEKLALHTALVKAISVLLRNKPPEVQSSVMAEILALWLGGWPLALRESLLENHLKAMRDLLPVVEVNTPELLERREPKH